MYFEESLTSIYSPMVLGQIGYDINFLNNNTFDNKKIYYQKVIYYLKNIHLKFIGQHKIFWSWKIEHSIITLLTIKYYY